MRTEYRPFALALLVAVTVGCSGSSVSEIASSAGTGLAASLPTLPNSENPSEPTPATAEAPVDAVIERTETIAPPLPENMDLFSPPKVVIPVVTREPETEPEPEAEPVEEQFEERQETTPPPPLRLLGFVEVDGLKALLTVQGKLNVVTIGDSVSGVEVIAVEAPTVTLRHGSQEFQMNLFEQEWFHAANPTGPLAGRQRSFGGQPVQSSGGAAAAFPGGMPALPGLSQWGDGGQVGMPDLPGFPGSKNEGGLPEFGDSNKDGGFPALPGFGGDEEGGLPGLPNLGGEGEGGLPGLPDFGEEGDGDLPKLP